MWGGVGHVRVGGESCRGGVGCVMQGDGVCHEGVGGSCRGWWVWWVM